MAKNEPRAEEDIHFEKGRRKKGVFEWILFILAAIVVIGFLITAFYGYEHESETHIATIVLLLAFILILLFLIIWLLRKPRYEEEYVKHAEEKEEVMIIAKCLTCGKTFPYPKSRLGLKDCCPECGAHGGVIPRELSEEGAVKEASAVRVV